MTNPRMLRNMDFDTISVRGKSKPDPTTGAIVPPIYQTATYVLEEIGVDKGFDYTRAHPIPPGRIWRSTWPRWREGNMGLLSPVEWQVRIVV